jgi:phosphate-selective porin OprO/OprP
LKDLTHMRKLFLRTLIMIMLTGATLSPRLSHAQDRKPAPDGTMGEIIEDPDDPEASKGKRWRLFKTSITTVKFGAGFLTDFVTYKQDDVAKEQMDLAGVKLAPDIKVRDVRLVASGAFRTKRSLTWKAGIMYDGVTEKWLIRESGVMVGIPEIAGHIFVGRTKEGFSLVKVMNGYAPSAMERQMALDVIPILGDGIKYLGFLPKQRLIWNIGVFNDIFSEGQGFSTYKWQFASRVGVLPIYRPEDKTVMHIAFNYRYGAVLNGTMRVRSRPEANPAPYFIDTGTFSSDFSNHYGLEAYYSNGPLLIGTESYVHKFNSPTENNPTFIGGEIGVSYMLTGESRPYNTVGGIYGFIPVKKSVFKGGPGAWEIFVRYTTLDLTSGNLQGGKMWRFTPMVNWYMSKDVRLEFVYGYGVLDRFGLKGATNFFQARLQLAFL